MAQVISESLLYINSINSKLCTVGKEMRMFLLVNEKAACFLQQNGLS